MLKSTSVPLIGRDIVPTIINGISTQLQANWSWKFQNSKAFLSRLQLLKGTAAGNLLWKKLLLRCIWPVFLSDAWRILPKLYGKRKYPLEPSAAWTKRLMSISKPGVLPAFRGLSLCLRRWDLPETQLWRRDSEYFCHCYHWHQSGWIPGNPWRCRRNERRSWMQMSSAFLLC